MQLGIGEHTKWLIKISLLFTLVMVVMAVAQSSLIAADPLMVTAVTIDLIFTIPIAYLFVIRNSAVPKITVVPVFFVCLFIASVTVGSETSGLLMAVSTFGVPAVELFVLGYLGWRIFRTRRAFADEAGRGRDLMERLRTAFVRELKPAAVARAAAFEVGTFFYIFLKWRRPTDGGFTYHRLNSPVLLLSIFVFLLAAETTVVHILLAMWSPTAAWIATALSVYFAIQIVAHLKALMLRPIMISDDELLLRCGIMGDAVIRLDNIAAVGQASSVARSGPESLILTPLGQLSQPNVTLELLFETTFYWIYGLTRSVKKISFSVDDPERFIDHIKQANGNL